MKDLSNDKLTGCRQAVGMLLQAFKAGKFQPGERIRETVLAEEFGMSRHALREALTLLEGWNLVEYTPFQGFRLRDFTVYDFLEWREMREAIEPIAARRLARNCPPEVLAKLESLLAAFEAEEARNGDFRLRRQLDMEFHLAVVENCGNHSFNHLQTTSYFTAQFFFDQPGFSALSKMITELTELHHNEKTREDYNRKNREWTSRGHRRMLDAIKKGDAEEAEILFRNHAHIQVRNLGIVIDQLKKMEAATDFLRAPRRAPIMMPGLR